VSQACEGPFQNLLFSNSLFGEQQEVIPERRSVGMADAWLCDTGIRVTDLDRSVRFYTSLLDLEELKRSQDDESAYVLFRDRRSSQRLELNWYSEASPFYAPFVPGEGLDHLEVRVRDVSATLAGLRPKGIHPVNRRLAVNAVAVQRLRASDPKAAAFLDQDVWLTSTGHHIAYVADPDGNLVCLYDHPEEDFDAPIPDHY
jgi:catechol 2,3-dioxygenase-like lactoylglutathione lyase family enzyme